MWRFACRSTATERLGLFREIEAPTHIKGVDCNPALRKAAPAAVAASFQAAMSARRQGSAFVAPGPSFEVPLVIQKRVLHVGCSTKSPERLHAAFRKPNWLEVRLDIDPRVEPDIVGTIVDMRTVKAASFDAVWSAHNLEHLEPHQVPSALAEFRRVLRSTGFLLITLPDLQQVAELVAKDQLLGTAFISPAGPIAPIDMIYGYRPALAGGNQFMAHRTGFTAKTLGEALVKADFAAADVVRGGNFDLWAVAYVTQPAHFSDPHRAGSGLVIPS